MSDNGGNAETGPDGQTQGAPLGGPKSKVFLGMDWATLNNTPFRRYKHFIHEGGIATPLIAHWPHGIPASRNGQWEKQPGHFVDIMPTITQITGATYPQKYKGHDIYPMQGESLVPSWSRWAVPRRKSIFWEHEGNRGVREGQWKLVLRHTQEWELYDMDADRTEENDLAAQQPRRVQTMAAQWDAWAKASVVEEWPGPKYSDWGDAIRAPKPQQNDK